MLPFLKESSSMIPIRDMLNPVIDKYYHEFVWVQIEERYHIAMNIRHQNCGHALSVFLKPRIVINNGGLRASQSTQSPPDVEWSIEWSAHKNSINSPCSQNRGSKQHNICLFYGMKAARWWYAATLQNGRLLSANVLARMSEVTAGWREVRCYFRMRRARAKQIKSSITAQRKADNTLTYKGLFVSA